MNTGIKSSGEYLFTKVEEPFVTLPKNSSSSKNREIFTLGTSTRTLSEFVEILKFYEVELVIDVRRWPKSKNFPHFNKENLERILKKVGIEYLHLEDLGGYRKEGYEEYMKSRSFSEALKRVIKEAERKRVCIVCAERFPFRCHRKFISQALKGKGFSVKHILGLENIYESK